MKPIDLPELSKQIEKFVYDRDWDKFHSVKNLSMALSVEASELVELYQWMSEEESNKTNDNTKMLSKTQDEISDIFIYLVRILQKTGIDLENSVLNKLKKNSEKYPIEASRGSSKKYTDLD